MASTDFASPAIATRLLEPGLWQLDPTRERYRVPGCGAIVIDLYPEDVLVVQDPEGGQPAEVVPFSPEGKGDPGILGIKQSRPANGLLEILDGESASAHRVRAGLERRGMDLASAKAAVLFAPDTLPGEEVRFQVTSRTTCAFAAPGVQMTVAGEIFPPTDLQVFVYRAAPPEERKIALPEPLADPRLDFQIDRCTAQAYEVKAGEYFQILDVAGRQCSDFQAFKTSQLDKGIECCIEMTNTRSLTMASCPKPGLHSKFFDQ
jgi:aminomethyltransferase